MDNKCQKYEGLFIFNHDDLYQHMEECDECRKRHEEFEKVSSLIDEVKFYYKKRQKENNSLKFKSACAAIFLFLSIFSAGLVISNEDIIETLQYGRTLSAEELGFPVDSYGLLMVENEWILKK